MGLLSSGITHGQAVTLVLLCIFLIVFIVADIYLVLSLRRKNKKLAKSTDYTDGESEDTENNKDNTERE